MNPVIEPWGEDRLTAALRGTMRLPNALTFGGGNPTQRPVNPSPNNPLPPLPGFAYGGVARRPFNAQSNYGGSFFGGGRYGSQPRRRPRAMYGADQSITPSLMPQPAGGELETALAGPVDQVPGGLGTVRGGVNQPLAPPAGGEMPAMPFPGASSPIGQPTEAGEYGTLEATPAAQPTLGSSMAAPQPTNVMPTGAGGMSAGAAAPAQLAEAMQPAPTAVSTPAPQPQPQPWRQRRPQGVQRGGFARRFAQGGVAEDNVLATLQTGETVVNTPASQIYGPELEEMNNLGRSLMGVPGYSVGGRVVGPANPLAVALAQGMGVPGFQHGRNPGDEEDIGLMTPAGYEDYGGGSYDIAPDLLEESLGAGTVDLDALSEVTGQSKYDLEQKSQQLRVEAGVPKEEIFRDWERKSEAARAGELGTTPAAEAARVEAQAIQGPAAVESTFARPVAESPLTGAQTTEFDTGVATPYGAEAMEGLRGALAGAQDIPDVTGAGIDFALQQPAAVKAQQAELTFDPQQVEAQQMQAAQVQGPEQIQAQEAQAAQLGWQPTDVVGQYGRVGFEPIREAAMRSGQELLGGLMAGRGGLGQTRSTATERMMSRAATDIASRMGAQEAQFAGTQQEQLRQAALAQAGQGLQGATTQAGMQQQANLMNPQMAQQAAMANQAAGLQTGLAQAGMQQQAGLANQATGLQASLANQQAGIQAGQLGLQQAQSNQAAALQAALANQATGMQGQQMGLTQATQQAGLTQQANLANQQAALQGVGLQGSLAGQMGGLGIGLGGLGLQAQTQQEQLRQSLMGQQQQAGQFQQTMEQQAGQFGQEQDLQRWLAEQQAKQAALGGIGQGAAGFFGSSTGGQLAQGLLGMIPGVGQFFS